MEKISIVDENKNTTCPTCDKIQPKLIRVIICDAEGSYWYKCSINPACKLFQIKKQ